MTDKTIDAKQAKSHRSSLGKLGIFVLTLAVMLFICAFGYGYFELAKVNVSLMHRVSDLQNRAINTKEDITTLQKSLIALQQSEQKAQALSAQQEQLIAEWQAAQKGDMNKWHVAEAQYLTKLANDYLAINNYNVALALLQRADQTMQDLSSSDFADIRNSLTTVIASLQSAPQIHTDLYTQLNTCNGQIDQLPLPINPLTAQVNQDTPIAEGLPWWRAGLERSWQMLRKLVIIRNTNSTALPLVLPEEKLFLYQNLHAQIENAMWAVLHSDQDVYKASLERAIAWTQQYFVQDAPETKNMLEILNKLHNENMQTPAVDLAPTLQLFQNYLAPQAKA